MQRAYRARLSGHRLDAAASLVQSVVRRRARSRRTHAARTLQHAYRVRIRNTPAPLLGGGENKVKTIQACNKDSGTVMLLNQLEKQHKALQSKYNALRQEYQRKVLQKHRALWQAEESDTMSLVAAMHACEECSRSHTATLARTTPPSRVLSAAIVGREADCSLEGLHVLLKQLRTTDALRKAAKIEIEREGRPGDRISDELTRRPVHHVRNPGCTHRQDTAPTVSNSEDQPDGSTLYVEFDMQACAQEYQAGISAEAPCESFFVDASSELIATVHPSAAPPSQNYHSTTAQLPLEDSSGATVETKSVIDTGAASCGMDADYRRKHFPNAAVRPSRRRFLDAQKQVMQLEGEMDLYVWIGDLRLLTVAYIFKNLGAQFLLGNNATTRHGLTISNYRGILYSEMPYATKDSQTAIASVRTGAATCSLCEEDCECSLKGACLTCDLDNSEFLLKNSKGTTRQVPFEPVDAGTAAAKTTDEDPVRLRTFAHSSFTTTIRPGVKARIRLDYDKLYHGPAATAELTLMPSFERWLKDHHCICHTSLYHSTLNRHAYTTIINNGDDPVTLYGNHKVATVEVSHETPSVNIVTDAPERVSFKLNYDPLASGLKWERMTTPPKETEVECTNGCYRQLEGRELVHEGLAAALAGKTNFELSEWLRFKIPKTRLTLATHVKATDGHYYRPVEELPFAESGRPRNRDDLIALGFSLEDAIDPTSELVDGKHKPLPEEQKTRLYELALRYWYVWSRDARTPELSWLVVLEIPTGDASPVAQKPYPMPYQYLEEARKEVQKLLDGGLIEPCISNWASPVLVRLKKDSTPENIKLKLIIDYRRLNEVTVPDAAGLGDMEEILDGFGGDQKFAGIVDAAGGFYQFLIHPRDRHKTAFVLPTSMGGTTFQWRVAPYGLARNPAGYSRGMMFALKGLDHVKLDTGQATGGAKSWIDDIAMHSNSFEGFADLFERVLIRLAAAGMSLKASKCLLLKPRLEVLGFYVTPKGLTIQDEKLEAAIFKTPPSSVSEIRQFLGAVQFYRRFVPRIALLAAPMNALLRKYKPEDPTIKPGTPEYARAIKNDPRFQKGSKEHTDAFEGVRQSFEAIMLFLRSSAVVSAPDLSDPLAEYVIVCDACDIAGGGALMQWQHPSGRGPGPPPGTPLRGGVGPDPLVQSWRHAAGWRLRTITNFSKTFNGALFNYNTFDKEAATALFCCRRWAKLITSRPTTIYTDSRVAATMLTKHLGPPKLQRWGIELGTFLPYLKIQYRKGELNGWADFLSRFPTFSKYIKQEGTDMHLPEPTFVTSNVDVPLFTHEVADTEEAKVLKSFHYSLVEHTQPKEVDSFWQTPENQAQILAALVGSEASNDLIDHQVKALGNFASQETFWAEQEDFERTNRLWERYVHLFNESLQRPPVVWDLCCGEGGYSRGAREAGCLCYGFDYDGRHRHRYEYDPDAAGGEKCPSGMTFILADVLSPKFWEELTKGKDGAYGHLPPPDMISISPPCTGYTRLRKGNRAVEVDSLLPMTLIDELITRLRAYETLRKDQGQPLVWHLENVPESEPYVTEPVTDRFRLCGTMFGHQVFRHRTIYCSYLIQQRFNCKHDGKIVGSRGARFVPKDQVQEHYSHLPDPNMYGVYSKPYQGRGTIHEWHGALGYAPNTYSARGLANALPVGYGRFLSGQMVATLANRILGCPIYSPPTATPEQHAALDRWATYGYRPLGELNFLGSVEPDSTMLAMDNDTTGMSTEVLTAPVVLRSRKGEDVYLPEIASNTPFRVTLEQQQADPTYAFLTRILKKNSSSSLHSVWLIGKDDFLYRRWRDVQGNPRELMYVPQSHRGVLLAQYHYSSHRGHRVLLHDLQQSYYWPGMMGDCVDFVRTCTVCGQQSSQPLQRALTNPIPTPSRPFSVIHVDHKGPLPESKESTGVRSKFNNILVVVCALTRFTLFIPVTSVTAEETWRILVNRVFAVFGHPTVIVSDNGPAFISNLSKHVSQFFGYRHSHILPYNAQANGAAESSVKRIKLLLDKHTKGHVDWHKYLPMLQLKLNATVHTGTGVSPFAALFGVDPIGIEMLEDPALYPATTSAEGEELIETTRAALLAAHKTLQQQSDAIKQARITEENARKYARLNSSKFGVVEASTATEPKYAWLIHGSLESAAYMRKHGHGLPWRHKYKVLETRPHAVKLEIPKDGSVPIVNEWQLRRRVAPAHPGEHTPGKAAPIITESGILIPTADPSFNPGLITSPPSKGSAAPTGEQDYTTDDEVYEIDKVHHAERVGNHFKIYLLWKTGEITWRWYHTLRKETTNEELIKEMREAVSAEIARRRITNPSGDTSGETDSRDEMPPPIDTEIEGATPPTVELGRGKRIRNPAQHYNASTFLVDDFTSILYASMILA